LRRWHIWLGWIVGIPILLWVVTGLVMVWKPIEEVRGEHLLSKPPPMRFSAPVVPPAVAGVPLSSLSLEPRAAGPRWVVKLPDGRTRLADPASGALLPPLSAADAAGEVMARYTGDARVQSVSRTDAGHPPLELRHAVATWKVSLDDGTNFYVGANSGMLHAKRTRWWRVYDFIWGLHIMDPATREDTHNPWVIAFGIVSLVTTLLALAMLPMTIRRKRHREPSLDS
jgi:hypothetical protein